MDKQSSTTAASGTDQGHAAFAAGRTKGAVAVVAINATPEGATSLVSPSSFAVLVSAQGSSGASLIPCFGKLPGPSSLSSEKRF